MHFYINDVRDAKYKIHKSTRARFIFYSDFKMQLYD